MRYPMDGYEAFGDSIELEITDHSSDQCLYISTVGDAATESVCVEVRGKDLDLLYETLKEFLGK